MPSSSWSFGSHSRAFLSSWSLPYSPLRQFERLRLRIEQPVRLRISKPVRLRIEQPDLTRASDRL